MKRTYIFFKNAFIYFSREKEKILWLLELNYNEHYSMIRFLVEGGAISRFIHAINR